MSQRVKYREFREAIKEIDLNKELTLLMVMVEDCRTWWWVYNTFYRISSQKGSQTMKILIKWRAGRGSQGYK